MKTITTLLNNASAVETNTPTRNTLRSSLKEMKGLVANTINTAVGVANEGLSITNDLVSTVPTVVQGAKEAVSLTLLFSRAVALNSVLTEKQIEIYNGLSPDQKQVFRKQLTEKGAHGLVNALSELFAEEESVK